MAKKQTFADKMSKQKMLSTCPVCGETIQPTLVLQPMEMASGKKRLKETRIKICKCNRKDIYG
jgi:hypothetical protein